MSAASRVRVAILALVVVLFGLLIAAAVALKVTDWGAHKGVAIQLVEWFSDWRVERLGDLHIEFFRPIRLVLDDFQLRQQEPTSSIASLSGEHAEVSFDPLTLLFGPRATLHDVRINGGRLVLEKAEQPEPLDPQSWPYIESAALRDLDILYRSSADDPQPLSAHLAQARLSAEADESITLVGQGTLADLAFELAGSLGSLDALSTPERAAPVALAATLADAVVGLEGQVALKDGISAFDLEVSAQGDNLARIAQVFGSVLEAPPAYELSFSTERSAERFLFTAIRLTLGQSRLTGDASLQLEGLKPYLRANLSVPQLRHGDIAGLIPASDNTSDNPEDKRLFSRAPLTLGVLHALDAALELTLEAYQGSTGARLLDRLTLDAQLENGRLIVNPLAISLAGGSLKGAVDLDARAKPAQLGIELVAERIDLARLLAAVLSTEVPGSEVARGTLAARLEWLASGSSLHELAAQADGGLALAMEEGAINAVVVEVMGLDAPEAALTWLDDNPLTDIRCAVGLFDIDSGLVQTRKLLLATADSKVVGRGTVDLAREAIDMTLEAHAKDFSFLASDAPIHLRGPLRAIRLEVVSGELVATLGSAALLGLVNPVLAALPLFEYGFAERGHCSALSDELSGIKQAAEQTRPGL